MDYLKKQFLPPQCSICLKLLSNGLAVIKVCGHVFHTHCILQQIEANEKCPLCRKQVLRNDHTNVIVLQGFDILEEQKIFEQTKQLILQNLSSEERDRLDQIILQHTAILKENSTFKDKIDLQAQDIKDKNCQLQQLESNLTQCQNNYRNLEGKKNYWEQQAKNLESKNNKIKEHNLDLLECKNNLESENQELKQLKELQNNIDSILQNNSNTVENNLNLNNENLKNGIQNKVIEQISKKPYNQQVEILQKMLVIEITNTFQSKQENKKNQYYLEMRCKDLEQIYQQILSEKEQLVKQQELLKNKYEKLSTHSDNLYKQKQQAKDQNLKYQKILKQHKIEDLIQQQQDINQNVNKPQQQKIDSIFLTSFPVGLSKSQSNSSNLNQSNSKKDLEINLLNKYGIKSSSSNDKRNVKTPMETIHLNNKKRNELKVQLNQNSNSNSKTFINKFNQNSNSNDKFMSLNIFGAKEK